MNKVEKLLNGGKGYAIKEETKVLLLPGLLLDDSQYQTAVVESGSIMFSTSAGTLETKHAPIPDAQPQETPKPAIVFPKRNK